MAREVRPMSVSERTDAHGLLPLPLVVRYTVAVSNVPQEAKRKSAAVSVRWARSRHPPLTVVVRTRVQVAPASRDRQTPVRVAAYRREESWGLTTRSLTQ